MQRDSNSPPDTRKLAFALCLAFSLWFYMFSPWTAGLTNFWLNMSISALLLSSIAISGVGCKSCRLKCGGCEFFGQLMLGIAIAFTLWGIFWLGDKVSQMIFPFARGQVDNVYAMKSGSNATLISILLLVIIGPAEEFFWRGYIQKTFSNRIGPNVAFVVTALLYALAHIWSFNFMLVMAALVAGTIWGLIYRLKPSLLPALVISHALWDALVFVIIPI